MLGRVLVTLFSAGLVLLGLHVADVSPPLSGGNFAGVILVGLGGLLFCRMVDVARRQC